MTDYSDEIEHWKDISEKAITVKVYTSLAAYILLLVVSLSSLIIVTLLHKRKEFFFIAIPVLFAIEAIFASSYFIIFLLDGSENFYLYIIWGFALSLLIYCSLVNTLKRACFYQNYSQKRR